MNEEKAEVIATLWRHSRAEADRLSARLALLERAVTRAIGGLPVAGTTAEWLGELAAAEAAAAEAAQRHARLVALAGGPAA